MTIFARTRHTYQSYGDFWKLAELSGYPLCFVDEIDVDSDETYVLTPMNGEVEGLYPSWRTPGNRRARLIWWFLERLDSTPMLGDGSFERHRRAFDQVWVSDRWMSRQHDALRHVVLGSDRRLGRPKLKNVYDYTHQSYVWGRREAFYLQLRAMGLREGPNAWEGERDLVLRRSVVMVHVQQYELPLYTPLRFALAAAYALPLVTERLADPYPLGFIDQAPFGELPALVRGVVKAPGDRGARLLSELCDERTFLSEVEAAL